MSQIHSYSHKLITIHFTIPIMMIHQQTMLASTIKPIARTTTSSSNSMSTKQQSRSVMFSFSTKSSLSPEQQRPVIQNKKKCRSSCSVPIPEALTRSPSELQLSVDEKVADERDFVFYARLVSGIRGRASTSHYNHQHRHHHYNEETERCLTHIMQTRHQEQLEQQQEQHYHGGVAIVDEEELTNMNTYCLKDLDCLMSSSSSSFSSSTYQQGFEHEHDDDHLYCADNECIFDLEM